MRRPLGLGRGRRLNDLASSAGRTNTKGGETVRRSSLVSALSTAAFLALTVGSEVSGQSPADLSAREKTEIFIRHLVRLPGIDPERYRPLVLEYEIGTALGEFLHDSGEPGADAGGGEARDGAEEERFAALLGGFLERALAQVYPEYGRLEDMVARGEAEEARRLAGELARSADPYLAAHARLAAAELEFAAASSGGGEEALEAAIRACEAICAKDRLYLVRDWRACQLVALSFERLKKTFFEFVQYALLLVDYNDIPKEVEAAVKARLSALAREIGFPLGTVADWMREVERLLKDEVTSRDPTQRRETEIVYALDKLIELAEARERKTCPSCGQAGCRGGCRSGRPAGTRSSSPAQVSAIPRAREGEVLLRGVSRGDSSTVWGQLKAREASRAVQAFKGKLPAYYEQLLEKYYENLSKME